MELAGLVAVGGRESTSFITSLAHRQVTGATIVTWNTNSSEPWIIMKEISSDRDVSTVMLFILHPRSIY